jgi:cytochrome c oxidase subunit 2
MASSPRTGRSSAATTALIIGAILILGIVGVLLVSGGDPIGLSQRVLDSLYPPEAVTSQGVQIRDLYTIVFLIAVVIFFVVEGLIVWTVLRYKRKPGDDALPPQTHGNAVAEVVWTVVPTLIVAFMFVISWQTLNTVDAVSATPDYKIRAIGAQFQWTFEYLPDDWEPPVAGQPAPPPPLYTEYVPVRNGEAGGLNVPAGRSVKLYLSSPDVIHAFYVPQFLFKRDVVPGRTNVFEFNVDERFAGQTFNGQCAELCGSGHSIMLFSVHAMAPTEFDSWLQGAIEAAPPAAPSGEPATSAPPDGSAPPEGSPPPDGSAPPSGSETVVQITALNIAFDPVDASVPADAPFQILFDNQDPNVPHNVAIKDAAGASVFEGAVFPGPAQQTYDVPPLPAGGYTFVCTVHPNMTGTLTAN